jgi:hypothetical protein
MRHSTGNNIAAIVIFLTFWVTIVGQSLAIDELPEIRTDKDIYSPNEEIVIFFENLSGHPRDWVALAKRGAPDQRPLAGYKYLKGVASGSTTLALHGVKDGEYEVRAYQGGGHEVLARYPFRIQVTASRTVKESKGNLEIREPPLDAQVPTEREEDMQTSPVQPLQPDLQRLLGDWIGHTRCDFPGQGRADREKVFLRVRADSTQPTGISAEVRGIGDIAGIALDVTLDKDRQQYLLIYSGWWPTGGGSKSKPYGLKMAFLDDREMLYGEIVTDSFSCATVVVGKLPSENALPNTQGLLSKVAVDRVLEPLSENNCAAYGNWLAEGEKSRAYGSALVFNSAVGNGPAMRRVLGHDLEQWNDDDTRKIVVIHRTCKNILQKSSAPELINLANDRIWGGIAPPLSYSKSKYPNLWRDTFFIIHRPLLTDIRQTWELIEEGILRKSQEEVASAAHDETGLTGQWRGYYRCEGGHEIFMRLVFSTVSDPLDVRLEVGSGLKTIHPFGVLTMTGSFDNTSGRITIVPQEWVVEPRGRNQPLGFEGQLVEGGRIIQGRVTGHPHCSDFSVVKREVSQEAVNQNGLLFHYLGRDMITADLEDCRAYAQWLAAGEEINLGGTYIFSDIRDAAGMRAALGKDLNQWGTDDSQKMLPLARYCQALLESQADAGINELLGRIKEKKLVWTPKPLDIPREDRPGQTTRQWLMAEQLVMVNAQQQELAARKLAEVDVFYAELASIDRIDVLDKEARNRNRGPFMYLSQQEFTAYLDQPTGVPC